MLVVIVVVIIFCIYMNSIYGYRGYSLTDNLLRILVSGIFIGICFACLIGLFLPRIRQNDVYEVKKLYPVENNFFIVDNNGINCLIDDDNDTKQIRTLYKQNTYISEGEYEEPYLEVYKTEFKNKWYWLFGIDIMGPLDINNYYVLYIPEGSINIK